MGFVYILKDKSSSNRGLASLKTRIVLSVLLFALLIVGYYMDMIKPNNFFLSDGFLGIPVYYIEKNDNISLEHTHPLQTYIMSENKYKIIKQLKENAKKIINR